MEKKWFGVRLNAIDEIHLNTRLLEFLNENKFTPEEFKVLDYTHDPSKENTLLCCGVTVIYYATSQRY